VKILHHAAKYSRTEKRDVIIREELVRGAKGAALSRIDVLIDFLFTWVSGSKWHSLLSVFIMAAADSARRTTEIRCTEMIMSYQYCYVASQTVTSFVMAF
jgi:hypothetical protein